MHAYGLRYLLPMAFTIAQVMVWLVLFALTLAGRLGTSTSSGLINTAIGDAKIGENSFCVEHGTIHAIDNTGTGSLDSTTTECLATLLSSSVNATIADSTVRDVLDERITSSKTLAVETESDDVDSAIAMKYTNIGFGETQMIQYDTVATQHRLIETLMYMYNNYTSSTTSVEATNVECKLHHELCAYWAVRGECDIRPGYMRIQCAPACFSCHDIIFEQRCPALNMSIVSKNNAWYPGDIKRMFERIVGLQRNQPITSNTSRAEIAGRLLPVTILSRPGIEVNGVSAPWILQIDDFLTPDECDTLIQLGTELGYQRSTGLNLTKDADGTYGNVVEEVRTSTNAWCLEDCHHHSTTQQILQRIEDITNIPDSNSEFLQLLHYDVGQFYKVHHDYIDFHIDRAQGVRLATVFLYLNDVEEGGGTNFPLLNLTVEPKRGRAVIWPSVLDSNPDEIDPSTEHQALPVVKGVKYGANSWIHQRDFKSPYKIHCTG